MAATRASGSRHFVFAGRVVDRNEEHVTVRLFPAATLQLRTEDVVRVEEATDRSTARSYVWVQLTDSADADANFRPRLAAVAASADAVPFSMGGYAPTVKPHGMPSGGAPSIQPFVDEQGIDAFADVLPVETEEELRQAARRFTPTADRTKYQTTSTTKNKTAVPTQTRTTDETGDFRLDDGEDSKDKTDEETDTAEDDKYDW